jgi:glyoxylase-like metal-dependent hydrolase (beta-lactamase superfamily II)
VDVKAFYDSGTNTLTYVVYDAASRDALVIDPVLNYDPAASTTDTRSVDEVVRFVEQQGLRVHYIMETHAHADHLSGSQALKRALPQARLAIGANITQVQEVFKTAFDLPDDFKTDGRQFDRLLHDGETLRAGTIAVEVLFTPGHTPACATYRIGDMLFTGDALFMPDFGTGRCDFPAGSARDLYRSITGRLYGLPDDTRVFVGHDYQPGGRELRYETSIGESKRSNVQLPAGRSEEEFVRFRTERDKTLSAPKLLFQSVQVNIDAGRLPEASAHNEVRYLKVPINLFRPHTDEAGLPAGPITAETVKPT